MESLLTFNNLVLILFIICFILLTITLVSLAIRYDKRVPEFKHIRNLSIASLLLCIVYYTAMHSINLEIAEILYPISIILYNAVIFFFYVYCEAYIKGSSASKKKISFVGLLMALDSISLIVNIYTKHIVYVEAIEVSGATLFTYKPGPLHIVHYLISIIIVLYGIYLLFREVKRTPFSYGRRFLFIAGSVIAVLLCNMLFQFFGAPVDISGIIIPYVPVSIYYYTIVFSPSQFLRDSRAKVLDEIKDAILIFDFRGVFRDSNKAAKALFSLDNLTSQVVINNWLTLHDIDLFSNEIKDFTDTSLPGSPSFRVYSFPYYDEKKPDIISGGYIRIHDRTEEIKKNLDDQYKATHDTITGLLNKNAFFDSCDKFLNDLAPDEIDHYLIATNIENFKMYNSLFGIHIGDLLLKLLADFFKKNIESAIFIGRIESDRFCILIPKDSYARPDFRKSFQDAVDVLKNEYQIKYPLNVCIGICHVTKDHEPSSIMYNHSLLAASSIKGSLDQFAAFYDDSLTNKIYNEQNLITELRAALTNDEFEFFLQPQINAKDCKIYGGEALVRWNHPTKGILSPFFFIGIMESQSMIATLDLMIWKKACDKLRSWKKKGIGQYISVNISAKDFYYMDICNTFNSLAEEYGIDKDKLKLEITESAIMQDEKKQLKLIEELSASGFTVEMDDFGSGYSSLSMLNKMQVDVLKLDMGFLQENYHSERSRRIIEHVVNMAHSLDMSIVAEGVETQEQADYLTSIGCDTLQGYLISPPIPVKEYEEKYL